MGSDVPSWIELTQSPPGRVWSGDDWVIFEGRWQDCPPVQVDHVISDPPYDARTHAGARYGFVASSSEIDFAPLAVSDVGAALELARRWMVCFCSLEMFGAYQQVSGAGWVRAGFWRRPDGVPQFSGDRPGQPGEGVAIMHNPEERKRWNGKGTHAFWSANVCRADRVHQTQKPVELVRQLVEDFTDPGELVWDPYAGSATTGVACLQLGRRFIGHELQAHYAEIAAERLQAAAQGLTLRDARAGQLPLFGGD